MGSVINLDVMQMIASDSLGRRIDWLTALLSKAVSLAFDLQAD